MVYETGLSQSKGFYKDQLYFKGAHEVLQQRKEINIEKMYFAKVNIEDVSIVKIIDAVSPSFMTLTLIIKLSRWLGLTAFRDIHRRTNVLTHFIW
jgi:type VI protein secretion system component Hcp